MAAKRLSTRKIRDVLRLKYELGFTHRTIAKALHVAVGTVSEYLTKAKKCGLSWPLPEELSDGELETGLYPPRESSGARPSLDYVHIHGELKRHRGLTLLQLWVEYAENNPGAYGYSRYCELYGRWKKKLNPTMRQHHRAGEKTFIDYSGKKPHLVDPKTGELVEVELFVAALGASSYTYAEATLNQSLSSWTKSHVGMSDYFGGSTEIWVPDNLKSGVERPDRYEPGVNRTYEELATHYGAVVVPGLCAQAKRQSEGGVGSAGGATLGPVGASSSHVLQPGGTERSHPGEVGGAECASDAEARSEPAGAVRKARPAGTESGFDQIPLERREEAFHMNSGGWEHQVRNIAKYVYESG